MPQIAGRIARRIAGQTPGLNAGRAARREDRRRLSGVVVDPPPEWTLRKLRILIVAIAAVIALVAAGAAWTAVDVVRGGPTAEDVAGPSKTVPGESAEDRLAARPLPVAPREAAQPGAALSSGRTGTLEIPPPMEIGPVGVAAGFPRTPQGALGQLVAIDSAALTSASVRIAQDVIGAWAEFGGPTGQTWTGVAAVATLLESAGTSADGDGLIVQVEPKMGFIKGIVGADFVIPCVDLVVTATLEGAQPQQVAAADCQRMVWQEDGSRLHGGRWVIGPGEEPAPAPSLWPGSQASFDAGYEWLEVPQQ